MEWEEVYDKYKISDEEERRIGEYINQIMLAGKVPSAKPIAIIDIGPTGSGKTALNGYALKQFENNNLVIVNNDELKPFHPKADEVAKLYPEHYIKVVNEASKHWTDGLMDKAIEGRYNVLYEGTGRKIRIFENMIANGKELDPRQQFYYARELYYNKRYEDAINTFNNFLDSGKGWVENCINACQDLSYCYYAISESKKALNACFRSFEFDEPRAEICCDIGKYFLDREQYNQAIFWYELALTRKINESSGGFILLDCYNFTPYIQLCLCYFRIGDIKKSKEYNEKAAFIKPNDPAVVYNNKFFASI